MVDNVTRARSRLAGLYRANTPDPESVVRARRELTLAKLERAVQQAIDARPPLTEEQREQVARLLNGGKR